MCLVVLWSDEGMRHRAFNSVRAPPPYTQGGDCGNEQASVRRVRGGLHPERLGQRRRKRQGDGSPGRCRRFGRRQSRHHLSGRHARLSNGGRDAVMSHAPADKRTRDVTSRRPFRKDNGWAVNTHHTESDVSRWREHHGPTSHQLGRCECAPARTLDHDAPCVRSNGTKGLWDKARCTQRQTPLSAEANTLRRFAAPIGTGLPHRTTSFPSLFCLSLSFATMLLLLLRCCQTNSVDGASIESSFAHR